MHDVGDEEIPTLKLDILVSYVDTLKVCVAFIDNDWS